MAAPRRVLGKKLRIVRNFRGFASVGGGNALWETDPRVRHLPGGLVPDGRFAGEFR
jgi:hypothetical protein